MWTILVLICVSWSFSEGRVAHRDPRHFVFNQTQDNLVNKSIPQETTKTNSSNASENMTVMTPSPVSLAKRTMADNISSVALTAGRTHSTDVDPSAVVPHTPDHAASGMSVPPALTLAQSPPSPTAALGTAGTQAPSSATLTEAAPLTTPASRTQPAAAALANASSPPVTHSHSPTSPAPPATLHALNESTAGPTIQALTTGPVADITNRTIPSLVNITSEPTPPAVASVATTAMTTTKAQAERPATTAVPAPVPGVGATSPTPQPSPTPYPQGPAGPGTPQTPAQGPDGTPSTRPAAGSSGDSKMSVTDSCQLSTQGQFLVVTTKPLAVSPNRSLLLAVLLLGVTLFFTVLVLFALQAYESYKKKDYMQVDYLINGMYADSEM